MQIHATNINGLGASQVVISFLDAYCKKNDFDTALMHLPQNGILSNYFPEKGIIKRYKRILPNSISRFIECLFSSCFFKETPTIVLGDIPLRGIKNQVVLVHQPNLIKPKINSFSSRNLTFKINRFLFAINHKYAKKIIVQTGAMANDMIASYPGIKDKVIISPQPVPNWLLKDTIIKKKKKNNVILFYPAAYYPHKKHDFLKKINSYLDSLDEGGRDFEIWLTLTAEEFKPLNGLKFIKNLGRLNADEMNDTYRKADALLFLSSMESYGLPLIEALTINLPILVADFNYSRWLCEDSAYYFDPYEEISFVLSLDRLIQDINAQKIINYEKELKKFPNSWTNVVEVFENAFVKI